MDKIQNTQSPELDKIQKNTIPNWTKYRTEKIPNGQNPELDKIQKNTIPNWTKPRTEKNPESDKIPNGKIFRNQHNPEWTKSGIGQNPEWMKSRIGQNPEKQNPEFYPLKKYTVRIKSVLTGL